MTLAAGAGCVVAALTQSLVILTEPFCSISQPNYDEDNAKEASFAAQGAACLCRIIGRHTELG